MTDFELLKRKLAIEKQWLWMLVNLTDEELQLPSGQTRQTAINKALDRVNYYLRRLKKLDDEK